MLKTFKPQSSKIHMPLLTYANFFPYAKYRPEQQEIIRQIELDARLKRNILLLAPSGTGKTVIALSALLPLAYEKGLKIIYLCRTHAQSARVIKELENIDRLNPNRPILGFSLRGRNEMCLNSDLLDNAVNAVEAMEMCRDMRINEKCIFSRNIHEQDSHTHNINSNFNRPIDAQEIVEMCKDSNECPYLYSKEMLSNASVVVCNYFWMFNPDVRSHFLDKGDIELKNCILVIDEAHNVVDIANTVNSRRLSLTFLFVCFREMKSNNLSREYSKFVMFLIRTLIHKRKNLSLLEPCDINPQKFVKKILKNLNFQSIEKFVSFLEELYWMDLDNSMILAKFWRDWISLSYSSKNYFTYRLQKTNKVKKIALEITALDAREASLPLFKNSYACVSLTGTINPYIYNTLTGFSSKNTGYKEIIANSPFKSKNIKAIIVSGVNTRSQNRNSAMYRKIIQKIKEVISNSPVNIGIFCASYKILKGLLKNGIVQVIKSEGKELFVERPGMSASGNSKMLAEFKAISIPPNRGGILLGVSGGRNSEGEDFPGDFMNSVIIVGIPYHFLSRMVNVKIDYYNKAFQGQGWLFGYLYPAMQRANQAAGRPIRKEHDKGAIIFLDSRFKNKRKWISEWIQNEIELVPDEENLITSHLRAFWYHEL